MQQRYSKVNKLRGAFNWMYSIGGWLGGESVSGVNGVRKGYPA
jgi:hypothetical protein